MTEARWSNCIFKTADRTLDPFRAATNHISHTGAKAWAGNKPCSSGTQKKRAG